MQNSTKESHIPFIQFPQKLTSCKTVQADLALVFYTLLRFADILVFINQRLVATLHCQMMGNIF